MFLKKKFSRPQWINDKKDTNGIFKKGSTIVTWKNIYLTVYQINTNEKNVKIPLQIHQVGVNNIFKWKLILVELLK